MSLRFHWMLPKAGEVAADRAQTPQEAALYRVRATRGDSPAALPDMGGWTHFARRAEEAGIESVLISFSRYEPEPFMVSCALGQAAERLKFIIAYRSGLMRPATFVQQVNTLSALVGGRVALNVVAGSSKAEQHVYGDFLEHDERYARAEEFLSVCRSFWRKGSEVNFDGKYYQVEKGRLHTPFVAPERAAPEIYISGHSEQAERLALAEGTCLLRVADDAEKLRPSVARLRGQGLEVCLRACVVCRPTREEAAGVAASLLPGEGAREPSLPVRDDSQMYREAASTAGREDLWLTRTLWAGLTPHYGPVWATLLGTPADIAGALLEYQSIGVTQFILSGWPELDELTIFAREVLPLVRGN
jgi:alkanesulfonate monooxygenase